MSCLVEITYKDCRVNFPIRKSKVIQFKDKPLAIEFNNPCVDSYRIEMCNNLIRQALELNPDLIVIPSIIYDLKQLDVGNAIIRLNSYIYTEEIYDIIKNNRINLNNQLVNFTKSLIDKLNIVILDFTISTREHLELFIDNISIVRDLHVKTFNPIWVRYTQFKATIFNLYIDHKISDYKYIIDYCESINLLHVITIPLGSIENNHICKNIQLNVVAKSKVEGLFDLEIDTFYLNALTRNNEVLKQISDNLDKLKISKIVILGKKELKKYNFSFVKQIRDYNNQTRYKKMKPIMD